MDIGKLSIKKAYLGDKELTSKNAFVGEEPLIFGCKNYVTFRAKQANSTVGLAQLSTHQKMWYSYDTIHWDKFDTSVTLTLVNVDDEVYVAGMLSGDNTYSDYSQFNIQGLVDCEGFIASIWNHKDIESNLKNFCGYNLFNGCQIHSSSGLEFPDNTSWECYGGMFRECTSMVYPSTILPAMELRQECYQSMFEGCSSLIVAPELPARTLATACYANMFHACISLQESPVLKAAGPLIQDCFRDMFDGCVSLNKVTCYLVEGVNDNWITERDSWLYGVSPQGTFIMHPFADPNNPEQSEKWTLNSPSGVPQGWTVQTDYPGLKFRSEDRFPVGLYHNGPTIPDFKYSFDLITWIQWDYDNNQIQVPANTNVYLRGNNPNGFGGTNILHHYTQFILTDSSYIYASGNIMSILDDGRCITTQIPSHQCCFMKLFMGNTMLRTAPDLPATLRSGGASEYSNSRCYVSMFEGCASLLEAPDLPSLTVGTETYSSMFRNCISLIKAPDLPAKELVQGSYSSMFKGCISLVNPPTIPKLELIGSSACYNMFEGCSSLIKSPDFITVSIDYSSFIRCFSGCGSLSFIKFIYKYRYNPSFQFFTDWVKGVASQGAFITSPDIDWPIGDDGIPASWVWKGLRIKGIDSNTTSTIGFYSSDGWYPDLKYSSDYGETWNQWDFSILTIQGEGEIWFKGNNEGIGSDNYTRSFEITGKVSLIGDIRSLLSESMDVEVAPDNVFHSLFLSCGGIVHSKDLEIPFKSLSSRSLGNMFLSCQSMVDSPSLPSMSLGYQCYYNMFKGCDSLIEVPDLPAMDLTWGCYYGMFYDCTSIEFAQKDLPATEPSTHCYSHMFDGCHSLLESPKIHLKSLKELSMYYMFCNCIHLNKIECDVIELPSVGFQSTNSWVSNVPPRGTFIKPAIATGWTLNSSDGIPSGWTVHNQEWKGLKFKAVGGSVTIGLLYALENSLELKYSIDYGNTWSVWHSGELLDINLSSGSEVWLRGNNPDGLCRTNGESFNFTMQGSGQIEASGNIMSLIDDGKCETLIIPSDYCFKQLFKDCTSLITIPDLPATELKQYCYTGMFMLCTGLIDLSTKILPAKIAKRGCYNSMFFGCSSITSIPDIQFTELADNCCSEMFNACTSLTKVRLSCKQLIQNCYAYMFANCSNLHQVECLANQSIDLFYWLQGVSPTGTFIKPKSVHYERGSSGIPEGWLIQPYEGLTFKAVEDSTIAISLQSQVDLWYSLDGGETWVDWAAQNGAAVSLSRGESMCVKGNNPNRFSYDGYYNQFVMSGKVSASGNIMSLIDNGACNTNRIPSRYCFCKLFDTCRVLITPPDLPAMELSYSCYALMFYNCDSLLYTPDLPASQLQHLCYSHMFRFCESLESTPILNFESVRPESCKEMFYRCSKLSNIRISKLPTADQYSYEHMFAFCDSIVSVPDMSDMTVYTGGCSNMFYGCNSLQRIFLPKDVQVSSGVTDIVRSCSRLNYIKCLTDFAEFYQGCFIDVANHGTFIKKRGVDWPIGDDGIPAGWDIVEVDE